MRVYAVLNILRTRCLRCPLRWSAGKRPACVADPELLERLDDVLDHGEGYYGVYAGFDVLKTKVGEVVAPRERVGFFRPSLKNPRFVFELLKDGEPVNPEEWFRNR